MSRHRRRNGRKDLARIPSFGYSLRPPKLSRNLGANSGSNPGFSERANGWRFPPLFWCPEILSGCVWVISCLRMSGLSMVKYQ